MRNYLCIILIFTAFISVAQVGANGGGLLVRAEIMAAQNNCRGALAELAMADRDAMSASDCERADFLKAQCLAATGQYEAAELAYTTFVAAYPQSLRCPYAIKGIADMQLEQGHYSEALNSYLGVERANLGAVDAAEVDYRLGLCYLKIKKPERAQRYFILATTDPSTRSAASFYLGTIEYDKGDYAAARNYFKIVDTGVAPADATDYYLASIDYAEGNYGRALTTARHMLRRAGLDAATVAGLNRICGESLYRQGQASEALPYLEKYLAASAEPLPSAQYIVAMQYFHDGNYSAALPLLRAVAENGEGAIRQSALLYIGQCLLETGDTEAAIFAFDKASKEDYDPEVQQAAYYNYAAAKYAGATIPFASAAEAFENFLRLYPGGPYSDRVAAYLAHGYMADNDYSRALERLNAIASPSPAILAAKQRVLYTLGMTALRNGDNNEAYHNLQQAAALAKYDKEIAAETTLGLAHLAARQGESKLAVDRYRQYLRLAPDGINSTAALYGLAYAAYAAGDSRLAEKYFSEIAAAKTGVEADMRADALNRLADIKFARGNFSGAYDGYLKAFNTLPSRGDYAALNAARMKGYMRDYTSKLDGLNDFRRRFPSSSLMPEALLEITQAQISLGRNDEAVETYRRLIADFPLTSQGRRGYLQMAMTLLDMGRAEEAAAAYRDVIAKYPTSDEAAQAAQLLRTIYGDAGRADEYISFISTVKDAPQMSADDESELAYESAIKALSARSDASQLSAYVMKYPKGTNTPAAYDALITDAIKRGNTTGAAALADKILADYPDSRAAEKALSLKAEALYTAGDLPAALEMWQQLAARASDAPTATAARLGLMRAAREMGQYDAAGAAADEIIASSASPAALSEAKFTKALVLDSSDHTSEAIEIWSDLAKNPADSFGARSAYYAANALHESGKSKKALSAAQAFVKAGTPHRYWMARTFILISDIYAAQGKKDEAKEYLEALRENYPGKDADIFLMIDTRLEDL